MYILMGNLRKKFIMEQKLSNHSLSVSNILQLLKTEFNLEFSLKGNSYFSLCPFHKEKTSSLSFEAEKKIFKCFGCNFSAGNVFKFWSQIKKIPLSEARKEIKKLGYDVGTEEEVMEQDTNQRSKIFALVSSIYQHNLFSTAGCQTINYLYKKRNLKHESIVRFGIGCSINYKQLTNLFSTPDLQSQAKELILSGLLRTSGYNSRTCDHFMAEQLIFPLQDEKNEIIAFAARRIKTTESENKYNYLPGHENYHKSNLLYNYFQVKKMPEKDHCYLVEGFFDVISLTQEGVDNCLALLGTNLSKKQIELLKKLEKKIVLFLDGDNSGRQATVKIIIALLAQDIECEVIDHSLEYDPDEICRLKKEEINQIIQRKKDPYQFILHHFAQVWEIRENPQSISNFIRKISNLFQGFKQQVHNFLVEKISSLINWNKEEVQEIYFASGKENKLDEQLLSTEIKRELQEKEKVLLSFCFSDRNYWLLFQKYNYYFTARENRFLYSIIHNFYTNNSALCWEANNISNENESKIKEITSFSKKCSLSKKSFVEMLMTAKQKQMEFSKIKQDFA